MQTGKRTCHVDSQVDVSRLSAFPQEIMIKTDSKILKDQLGHEEDVKLNGKGAGETDSSMENMAWDDVD